MWGNPLILFLLFSRAIDAEFPSVPLIDVSPWTDPQSFTEDQRLSVVREIGEACSSVGFFQITNHQVSMTTLEGAWKVSRDFFELPKNEKQVYKTHNLTEYPFGYEDTEQLTKGKALDQVLSMDELGTIDSKETFAIGPNNLQSGYPLRKWMSLPTVPDFQASLETYYEEMESLTRKLLEIFALALDQPLDFFVDKIDHHMSALRLIHYYPLIGSHDDSNGQAGVVRAGAHTDYGALTILNSEKSGLQVLLYDSEDRKKTQWYTVPTIPGSLIINLGDLMQRWTNDRWVSTLHRVVMPMSRPDDLVEERRYSMAFFCNINGDTVVETLTSGEEDLKKYPPILAKDHLMAKVLASMGDDDDDGVAETRDEL